VLGAFVQERETARFVIACLGIPDWLTKMGMKKNDGYVMDGSVESIIIDRKFLLRCVWNKKKAGNNIPSLSSL